MNVQQNKGHWRCRRAMLILLTFAVFLATFMTGGAGKAMGVQSEAPLQTKIYAYNTNPAAVYILTGAEEPEGTIYRVYTEYKKINLLGQATAGGVNDTHCTITLQEQYDNAKLLYVSRQAPGETESSPVVVTCQYNPSVQLNMVHVNANEYITETSNGTDSSNFIRERITATGKLQAGEFYQVEVLLKNFPAINSVLIPLRYNTEYLEPAAIYSDNVAERNKLTVSTRLANAKNGMTFDMRSASYMNYGVLPGYAFYTWTDENSTYAPKFSYSTTGGAYQYLNTTTGLYRLEAGINTYELPAPSFGLQSGKQQFVRFFFRALQNVNLTELPVHFATEADCPESERNNARTRSCYYDPLAPDGILPLLDTVNVMTPTPPLKTVGLDASTVVSLKADELNALPDTYYSKISTLADLNENEVRVYNYTNYDEAGRNDATLDGALLINDYLKISASTTIQVNDTVRVYLDKEKSQKIGEGEYTNNGVEIDLGCNNLSPAGGVVYVTVVHKSYESGTVKVSYPAEATRDVTFRIYRSSWTNDRQPSVTYNPPSAPLRNITSGERFQIRIYFNNFSELMMYGFAIHFNPDYAQVTDIDYNVLPTGRVTAESYKNEESCFTVGADLADVTFTEQLIHQASQRGDEADITALMTQLGIASREEFDQIAADVAVKYTVSGLPWKGGLVFTGGSGASGSPYIDNEQGFVRFASATLENSSLTLHRAGGGYHFITINFQSTLPIDPGFRLMVDTDPGYSNAMPGQQLILAGGGENLKVTQHWEVWPMGSDIDLKLSKGNALDADLHSDQDAYDEYLYEGSAYRDPGFALRLADGSRIPAASISRYYLDENNVRHDIPYTENERITDFRVRDNACSDHYVLHYYYEYVAPERTQVVQAERDIYIIYKKGDVNRDGEIDLFDEQLLADYWNGITDLDDERADPLFWNKTADVNGDGRVNMQDREAIRSNDLWLSLIKQDYTMPVE